MKWMERTYRVGDVVEKIVGPVADNVKPRAGRKRGSTTERQFERNDKAAARKLARLINANFQPGDMFITLTYDEEHLCGRKEAEKQVRLFLDRVRRALAKEKVALRWIMATSDMDGESGEPARIHHHLLLPRLAYEIVCEKWREGTVDYQLLRHQKDYYRLAVYLLKQAKREPDAKKYSCSRNLVRPVPVREKIVKRSHQPFIPRGAVILERSGYEDGMATQYVRYIAPPKKPKGEKGNETE